jgi:putative acetyltransferase
LNPFIREISSADNHRLSTIIPQVLLEFGASGKGFASADPEIHNMYEAYQNSGSRYWVVEYKGIVEGGGGIGPLKGADESICELQKMYFSKAVRGRGLGGQIMNKVLEFARKEGYKTCYLETLPTMTFAQNLYTKFGFRPLKYRVGNTGHTKCPTFMALEL